MYITWQVLVCAPFLVNHWLGYRIPLLLIQGLLVAVLLICLPYSHATNHFPHCLFFFIHMDLFLGSSTLHSHQPCNQLLGNLLI